MSVPFLARMIVVRVVQALILGVHDALDRRPLRR
jgi:hypothetical protein